MDDPRDHDIADEQVALPRATRDLVLQALREAGRALRETHRMRATRHIFVEEGIHLTRDNSFQIYHGNPLLLVRLAQRLLEGK